MRFLKDVLKEFKKVRWLSKNEATKSTIAVITTTVVVVVFFVIVELGITNLKELLNW